MSILWDSPTSGSGLSGYSSGLRCVTTAKDEGIGGSDKEGASHNVSEGDGNEVGADEVPKGEGGPACNAQRYEEHVCHCTTHRTIEFCLGAVFPSSL